MTQATQTAAATPAAASFQKILELVHDTIPDGCQLLISREFGGVVCQICKNGKMQYGYTLYADNTLWGPYGPSMP